MMFMTHIELMGVNEAARALAVSRATVHRWADSGHLKALGRIGVRNVLVFDRRTVEELAAKGKSNHGI